MANAKNLVSFAKKGKKTSEEQIPAEKSLTPAEERDIKAKQKVEELLEDVNLEPKKSEDVLELDETKGKDAEWLSEQVTALTSENEILKSELEVAKTDYRKIFDENLKIRSGAGIPAVNAPNNGALMLFNELQANYLKFPAQTKDKTTVNVRYLLNRMCDLFPEVKQIKKF